MGRPRTFRGSLVHDSAPIGATADYKENWSWPRWDEHRGLFEV